MTRARWRSRARTGEAAAFLLLAWLLRMVLPGRRLTRLLGRPQPALSPAPAAATPEAAERAVAAALARADSRLPLSPTCLDLAVAARFMLRRRGDRPTIVIGLDRADPTRPSHAWLRSGRGCTVVGGEIAAGYVGVTEFR